jgi:hypothetical protein
MRSAFEACLHSLSQGRLPAAVPTTVDGKRKVFAVAVRLHNAPRVRAAAFSDDQDERLLAAFVVLHEAREQAKLYGYTLVE